MAFNPLSQIPVGVLTDSYKATHFEMYPDSKAMVAYGEFRGPYQGQTDDHRFIFYGMRYLTQTFIERQWTMDDVDKCSKFYSTHNAGNTPFPFPKELFERFVKENNGYFPVKIEALPEGTVAHVHVPVYQITAKEPYTKLVTFLETMLTMIWYPTTVATLSRMCKDKIQKGFEQSVDEKDMLLLESRLHDFGFRGCTGVEQATLGGSAHLLNFSGSDTMCACYYVQFHLNNGKPIGTSIPATEHSVMTAWPTEKEAIELMINKYGSGLFSTVMDSYDYTRALTKVVPSVKELHLKKGGLWVFRPDSGDPVEAILEALRAGEAAFGAVKNGKGYKVLNNCAALQGDGINKDTLGDILDAVLKAGYSAQNVAFGMGGGLLQKVNRDTMAFATKLSYIKYTDEKDRLVMKLPKTDSGKTSLPGVMRVKRDAKTGQLVVFPRKFGDDSYDDDDVLRPVYDNGPIKGAFTDDFDTIRKRAQEQWNKAPLQFNPISEELQKIKDNWIKEQRELLAKDP